MIKNFMCLILQFFFVSLFAQSKLIDSVSLTNSLYNSISFLSSNKLKGRFTGTKESKEAASYIADKFENAGLYQLKENDRYFQHFTINTNNGDVSAINVMGILPSKDSLMDSVLLITAHYDHIGHGKIGAMKSSFKDNIYNGANDNAAGVAAIIEIAKYYSYLSENKYDIIFIAFDAEEWGLLGSEVETKFLNTSLIKAVINLDMIGRPIDTKTKKCMVVSEKSKQIISKLNGASIKNHNFFISDQFPGDNMINRTDQASFNDCEYSFSLVCSSPNDEYYHAPNDTIETIDFPFLTTTVMNIAEACRIFVK
jgi:Zn-dependent M28 family amino/carboxypeptidase